MQQSATRRGVLGAAGAALLGGCSELQLSEESSESIRSTRLPDVSNDGEPEPIVVETVPVAIERRQLAARAERVTELLETLPLAFGPTDVPNGHIREKLLDAADDATTRVQQARTARSRLEALLSLREARAQARYAAAGWAFLDDGRTEAEVRAERQKAIRDAESLRARNEYLGADPIEATLVYGRIERALERIIDGDTHIRESSDLLRVAEWGEHAESTRGRLEDARYLHDRFSSSLSADTDSIEATLRAAAESLTTELRERKESLPAVPTEDQRELEWRLRYRLHDDAESSVRRATDAAGPAASILAATKGLVAFRAYDRLRDRLDGGERLRPENAADLRETRQATLEAIRTALEESRRPELARPALADAAGLVALADEELTRYDGEIRLARFDDPIQRYTSATVRARSVPAALASVIEELTG